MSVEGLTNGELRDRLIAAGANVGPITDTTRSVWLKKLITLEKDGIPKKKAAPKLVSSVRKESRTTELENTEVASTKKTRGRSRKKALEPSDTEEEEVEREVKAKRPPTPSRRSPAKPPTSSSRLASPVIPGLANFSMNNGSSKKSEVSSSKLSSYRGGGMSSELSFSRRSGASRSFGYSDGEDEVEVKRSPVKPKVDASINTSFKRPSLGRSPLFQSSPLDNKPLFNHESSNSYYGNNIGRSTVEIDTKFKKPSPLKDAMDRLSDFRSKTYRRITAPEPVANLRHEPNYGNFRYSSEREKTSSYRKPWNFHLSENTSRILSAGFVLFIALLAIIYIGSVHRSKIMFGMKVMQGAAADTGVFIYNNLIIPLLITSIIIGMVAFIYWFRQHQTRRAAEEKREVFDMVNQVLDVLQKTSEQYENGEKADACVPIPHIRDILIPPSERKEKQGIWLKAVEYINENESRIRTETQFISGMETSVWRCIQSFNSPGSEEKKWQGHAFSDAPHQMALNSSPINEAYSECLKLRGMFGSPEAEDGDDWPEHIQDALLEKLGKDRKVVHVAVDRASKDGCVYMKLASKRDAGSAFKLLHGSWFNGRLVSVKYLRPERYDERFPTARHAIYPLEIKKPRQSVRWE